MAPYDTLYLENIVVIMSTALLWFDYTLTFSSEVKRIWQRRFTGATALFLVVRYSALFERVLSVIYRLNTTSDSDDLCAVISTVNNVLNVLYMSAYQATIVLRMYGISAKDWRLTTLVFPFSLVPVIIFVIFLVKNNGANVHGSGRYGCVSSVGFSNSAVVQLPIIGSLSQAASVGILIGVTLYKTYSIKRDSSPSGVRMPLSTVLIQDGTVFFAVIMFCLLVAMLPKMTSGPTRDLIATTWPVFYPSLTTIVHSRFILNLRGLYLSDSDSQLPSVSIRGLSESRGRIGITTSNIIGNLGASMAIPRDMEELLMGPSAAVDAEADDDGDEVPQFSRDPFRHGMTAHAGSSPCGVGPGPAQSLVKLKLKAH